jgi:formate dehydrogenase beta subunit
MTVTRRTALKALAIGGATIAGAKPARASEARLSDEQRASMLYDTTRCIGCKACVVACAEANGLAPDSKESHGMYQMPRYLNDQTKNIIKLYNDPNTGLRSFVKAQCMHCMDPACVAGCPMAALQIGEKGVVLWDGKTCIGCRYCQIACPFNIPKFEWNKVNPKIVKCEFCRHRLAEGKQPACCEVCPREAVIYGNRAGLLKEAKKRIANHPGRYYADHVYGEFEAGGTQVLYLTHIDPKLLGHLVPLGSQSLPASVESVQNTLYMGFLTPVIAYGAIASILAKRWKAHEKEAEEHEKETGWKEQL